VIAAWLPPFGTAAGEGVRALLLLVAFFALLVTAELWHRRAHPPGEWTRKLVHFGAGLMAAALPWILASPWTLLAVATAAGVPVLVARARGGLGSVFDVERDSLGEVYFPIAIFILFLIGRELPIFYLVALLTMVVADALAAVLGRAYGKHPYLVTTHQRSLEGSAAFLLTAFFVVHVPLLLATSIDRVACLLIAAQIALLVTSFEAIGTGGSDNLLVPLGAYYLLVKLTGKPVESIALQLAAQVLILIATVLVARRTHFLTFSGAVAAHLVLYAAFSLGGPAWIVAPALALGAAIVMEHYRIRARGTPSPGHHVAVVFYVSIVAVLLIFADNTFATLVPVPGGLGRGHPFLAPFVGSLAAAIAIVTYLSLEVMPRARRRPAPWRALVGGLIGFAVVVPLGLWAARGDSLAAELATAALSCLAALALFLGLRRAVPRPAAAGWNLRYLALAVLGATIAVMPLHFRWIGAIDWRLR
jgi:phytol kinase